MSLPGWFPGGAEGPDVTVDPGQWMRRQLFDRRVVVLDGFLDDARSTEAGAGLMALDADGDDAVDLRIDCAGGSTGAALALMDIIDLLGVTVRAWCTGQAGGPAVGILAVSHQRTVSPHTRLHLTEPTVEFEGSARHLTHMADAHAAQWSTFCGRLADAAGRPVDRVREDTARGRYLTAPEAVAYGLADAVASRDGPGPGNPGPGHPLGFRADPAG